MERPLEQLGKRGINLILGNASNGTISSKIWLSRDIYDQNRRYRTPPPSNVTSVEKQISPLNIYTPDVIVGGEKGEKTSQRATAH